MVGDESTTGDRQGLMQEIPSASAREPGTGDLDYLRELQALGPLVSDRVGILFAFSLEHLQQLLTSPHTRQPEVEVLELQGIKAGPMHDFAANSLLYANGKRHRARRRPLVHAFALRVVKALRADIRACAEQLIKPLVGAGPFDFLDNVAGPLPALIIASILGAPEADIPRFTQLVYSAIRALSVRSPEVMTEAMADMGRLTTYVDDLLAERRAQPRQDFLSDYLESVADGDLEPVEVRMQIVTLILAGADTTRLTLAMTFAQLLHNPDQWSALLADPEAHVAGAVAEGMRCEPVIGSLARVTVSDFELVGHRIGPGMVLAPMLITALRDPTVYAEPDRFDIARNDHPRLHPIFGGGPHRCLGEALAHAELEETLKVLARLAPQPALVGSMPRLRGLGAVRGLEAGDSLTVSL